MPYYQGDFYRPAFPAGRSRGDFYQGDPGFWSFLGGIAKKAVGFIPGVGPLLSSAIPSGSAGGISGIVRQAPAQMRRVGTMVAGGVARHPVLSAAGAAGAIGAAMGAHHLLARGGMRRRRRMNVCNQRALRRSLRRVGGFARVARKVLHFTHPRAARGAPRFKYKRKRAA